MQINKQNPRLKNQSFRQERFIDLRFRIRGHGFTLTEMVISISLSVLVFAAFAAFAIQALRTFTWLTATNVAHQQARSGIQHMLQDIHASPSPVMLVNVAGDPAPAPGTFWGVVYQRMIGGPFEVPGGLDAGVTTAQLLTGNAFTPQIGQMLVIPNSNNLYTITNVGNLSGNLRSITFSPAISQMDAISPANNSYNGADASSGGNETLGVFVTVRSAFLVRQDSGHGDFNLRHYPLVLNWAGALENGLLVGGPVGKQSFFFVPASAGSTTNALDTPATYSIISRGLRGVKESEVLIAPFSDPLTAGGASNRQSVAAVQLSLQDSKVSNLIDPNQASNYRLNATTIFLNSIIPQQYILTPRN